MNRLLMILCLQAALFAVSGCETRKPAPDGRPATSRAERAQDELSQEVGRLGR